MIHQQPPTPMNNEHKPMFRRKFFLIPLAFFILALVYWHSQTNDLPSGLADKWQAVFLTDGQVYFGKLENDNSRYVDLQNVYYLKFAEGLQGESASASVNSSSGQNLNLIKLGGEAHGPEDEMYIAKDKILFFENLKSTSPVVQAILQHS
jgi:hypothetical protein